MASDSNPGPVLEIDDLHVAVEGKEILQGVSLAVPAGVVTPVLRYFPKPPAPPTSK